MTNHLGPGRVVYLSRRDEEFRAECDTPTEPRHTIEGDVDDVDCDACLDLAARRKDTDTLASCPTIDDLVERTDATRDLVLATLDAAWMTRRVTDRIFDRNDRVVVLNVSEREIIEAAILDALDEEDDR